jgi:hypothetical protein
VDSALIAVVADGRGVAKPEAASGSKRADNRKSFIVLRTVLSCRYIFYCINDETKQIMMKDVLLPRCQRNRR